MGERLSKSEPPIQNIPIRTEAGRQIKDGFLQQMRAAEQAMAKIDFAEIEARILAELGPGYEASFDGRVHDEFSYTVRKVEP
ncbi:DNA polymerase [Caulobacter virus Karma]|uniref:Pol I DNA polymerase, palm domain n=5 Tax=Viruses TaxID=10239 RepID=J3UI84_9CAUD|nr:DNA polymerase [Caulobacter phage phiCbK]YP_006988910.1 DNA polymerase [Caulobacter virus Magneto]YP_006989613.1 DNA polymerase [Caulobacter virus Karma]ARB13756.1 hypothetical protein Ccr10_gp226c [Caulobacter phage Ccr10]ARB14101.1 hypothetical protein Ccr2_gp225c [Caulobacter phage Ccr2]ARB14790.1 hypothetical protein Ccr29_gp234 [Caulobacter phage Ccr29]ARB15134.1 hypothetical protein Ccr32_gp216 [Caulobacter phage Ccr32]ARB15468.1 hypothetical protein Ccr34_gp226 [Caulobacter phage C